LTVPKTKTLPDDKVTNQRQELATRLLLNRYTEMNEGIVDFKINFWYVLAYLKGIQDVGVFVSAVVSILIFFGQTVPKPVPPGFHDFFL